MEIDWDTAKTLLEYGTSYLQKYQSDLRKLLFRYFTKLLFLLSVPPLFIHWTKRCFQPSRQGASLKECAALAVMKSGPLDKDNPSIPMEIKVRLYYSIKLQSF
jgi:hypothetical protein